MTLTPEYEIYEIIKVSSGLTYEDLVNTSLWSPTTVKKREENRDRVFGRKKSQGLAASEKVT